MFYSDPTTLNSAVNQRIEERTAELDSYRANKIDTKAAVKLSLFVTNLVVAIAALRQLI